MAPMQTSNEIEDWYKQHDPWGYESNPADARRRSILLSELPSGRYQRVLDIGCGEGFMTQSLPGNEVLGIDVSARAIERARRLEDQHLKFAQCSIFDAEKLGDLPFDLIVMTGVLYEQYIGRALPLVYRILDQLLADDGVLISVHIDAWYRARFPYLLLHEHFYPYREYTHRLEIYVK
jgi:predicted TPR repeat methyltransferase